MIRVERQDWNVGQPRPLQYSWPLYDLDRHFDLGCILNAEAIAAVQPATIGVLGWQHAGCWECDLEDNRLTWSGGVFDIFGLPRNAEITRENCLLFYSEGSRAALERLRSHAIVKGCGFTLDAQIRAAVGETRWIRVIAAPVREDGRPVRLHGLKLVIR